MSHAPDCECRERGDDDHDEDCFGCTCRCKCHITDFGPCDYCTDDCVPWNSPAYPIPTDPHGMV